ncbi:MAG: 6-carboxytetrahydropterin synthase [Cyanobacteria bacterium]|nr:6-carboxytetrahydropterin synthase [Cyanobacteriota bacterium]
MTSLLARKPTVYLTRSYDFSASHRLYNPTFTDEDNWSVFRQCNNPNGHGHNYELEVTLSGIPDLENGMIADLTVLDAWIQNAVILPMDHKHLNMDVPFLQGLIPTAETIVVACWQELTRTQPAHNLPESTVLYRLRLKESKNNFAEYFGKNTPVLPQLSPQSDFPKGLSR